METGAIVPGAPPKMIQATRNGLWHYILGVGATAISSSRL
eukprot:COSAG05_NODE_373_length_10684_cov_22.075012_15_plen_40_part_00